MRARIWNVFTLLGACGAGAEATKEIEATEATQQAKVYNLRGSEIEQGELAFGAWIPAEFRPNETAHAWTFSLTSAARVTLRTEATSQGEVDTVLSIYRESEAGWDGAVASNDNTRDSVLSSLSKQLKEGRYRVVVQAGQADISGGYILATECRGDGCPAPEPVCLFGSTFYDLLHGEERNVEILNEEWITSVTQVTDPISSAQLVLAVQQSSHTDVTTAAEALSRVDQQTVRRLSLLDEKDGRLFAAYEYGVGDNSYGAIFAHDTLMIVASIHDGDFLDCTAQLAQCILPTSLPLLRESTKFATGSSAVLTRSSIPELSSSEQTQLLATLRLNYSETVAPTLESAIDFADGGQVNQIFFHELETGRELIVYEHGAGDTSVGAVFEGDDPTVQAEISDGTFEACQLTRTAPVAR
jgi:hypothetical protein